MTQTKVVLVGAARLPFARAGTNYSSVSNQDMMTTALEGLVKKFNLQGNTLGDVSLGATITHARDWNIARECVLGSRLSAETPAFNVQRACGTSLEAVILIANKIATGQIEAGIAGGTDSMSDLPIAYPPSMAKRLIQSARGRTLMQKFKPFLGLGFKDFKPSYPAVIEPRTGKSMGEHCEMMVKDWQVSRQEQDQLTLESHQKASAAYQRGFYKDLVIPYQELALDNNIRPQTTLEKLARLKPAFDKSSAGTLTAGNSTPLTDGAACVLLASEEWAQKKGLPILAKFVDAQVSAVDFIDKEGLLLAPAYAVSQLLQRQNLKLQDFAAYEIHEAFAGQVLCTLKAWESETFCKERLGLKTALGSIERTLMNQAGGSVAIGHPFGATGARLVGTLGHLLAEQGKGRGLISVCTGGGMGVSAIFER